jgi:hypothetical protein
MSHVQGLSLDTIIVDLLLTQTYQQKESCSIFWSSYNIIHKNSMYL